MSLYRHAARALAAATALTAFATPAAAQQIDRIVVFGDSYADTGNLFALGYNNPQARQTYPTGRFSGGSNYIDNLSQILAAPVSNYAIGGAMGGTNSSVVCGDLVFGAVACGKGLQYQVDQFLNVGTQSAVFPTTATSFTTSDLLALSIGGNDARAYQLAGGPLATAGAAGTQAAVNTATQLNRLIAGGTPTISFLAGNTAQLPEVAGNTAAQAVRQSFSTAYNGQIQQTLAGYAANGAVVHYLDLSRVLNNIAANPTAYGLTSVGPCPAAQATTCVSNAAFANQYLFYVDALHLSSQGFNVVARYVAAQLDAPLALGAASDMAMESAKGFGRVMTTRLDIGSPRDGDMLEGLRFWINGDLNQRSVPAGVGNNPFTVEVKRLNGGVEMGAGPGVIGLAIGAGKGDYDFGDNSAFGNETTVDIGAYAGFGIAGGFAQGYVGYGRDKYELNRTGVVLPISAETSGKHYEAGAKIGYLMPMFGGRFGPVATLDYARGTVYGYTEKGDTALNLNVRRNGYHTLRGSLGGELRGDINAAGLIVRPFTSLAYEMDLDGDARSVRFSQTATPGIVNTFEQGNVSKKGYGRFSAGLATGLTKAVRLDAGLSMTMGKEQGNETAAQLGISLGF